MTDLTPCERHILMFITDYIAENEYPPTMKEIGKAIGNSYTVVHAHVHSLREKGRISFVANAQRTIRVLHLEDATK